MKYFVVPLSISFFLLFLPVEAKSAATRRELDRIESATRVFSQMPGRIPSQILNNAKGIAVIPGELKASFIFGAELGGGIIVSRLPDGNWSPPAFISLAGASFGFQAGGMARDIVLVFNSARSMEYIEDGWIKLGADASVAAGPIGTNFGVSTDLPEIYAYVRSVGAFLGAAVEGSLLSFDFESNRDLYGIPDPLRMQAKEMPMQATKFSCSIAKATGAAEETCG